ncbi:MULTISPECIES: hypothetical protein [unclassified Bacillus (in: firmicutes)]|uniref:hypothetical protein n=1 Tax=unclassified Bacillus (in: firmicutes) TaxID=185979 RepID=UPI0008DFF3AD|nr:MULTISPECIES: hypothetical protein [unclassified Bacillus (in: firmicutes)]SFB14363.1 hypothetical protein SAMN02799634_106291 [Bacillus sp. UNCCL13]SFQ89738.1 hypothetical protein SAMN04488577_3530 [Bacillus sp. cl95]
MRTKNIKPYAYGSLYKQYFPDGVILPVSSGNLVDFDIAGPYQNTRPDVATNRIRILKSGVYQITSDVSVILEEEQSVLFNINLCANGSDPLIGSFFDAVNISTVTGKTIQAFLNVGDEIGIFIAQTFSPGGRPPRYNRSALTVLLLDY